MQRFKQKLINIYNALYDVRLDIQLYFRWKNDLKVQKKYGLPRILSIEDTLDKILYEKKSLCRYGDGEFKIMDGESIFFQEENDSLSERLKEVVVSKNEDILVCIPAFLDRKHYKAKEKLNKEEKKRRIAARKYLDDIVAKRRLQWYTYFDMTKTYGDSLISRFYAGVYDDEKSRYYVSKWKQIWEGRNLLIIEGEKTRMGVGNDLFEGAGEIRRILAPTVGAFVTYGKILETAKKEYRNNELILIALGPTATILAYDLTLCGIQALDIGHIDIEYEWYLRKDRTHKKIIGKFVSEAQDGAKVEKVEDAIYESQIISKIGG